MTPLAAAALVLLLAGCDGAEPAAAPTSAPTSAALSAPTAPGSTATPSATPTATATPEESREGRQARLAALAEAPFEEACEVAGPGWCADVNANGLPDLAEEEAGLDPATAGCEEGGCGIDGGAEALIAQLRSNTVFVLDASGSMAGDAGGQTKMAAAKQALVDYATATPDVAELGLVVYGHRGDNSDAGRAESCAGVEVVAPVGAFTAETAPDVVAGFDATGWTPIATALDATGPVLVEAAEADAAEGAEAVRSRVVLISDGIETCDGDPVAAAAGLQAAGIEVVVDVIGFDLADGDRAALQAVAEATGGTYADARTGADLRAAFDAYTAQYQEASAAIACQMRAIAAEVSCSNRLKLDVTTGLRSLKRAAYDVDDDELGDFIDAWTTVLLDRFETSRRDRLEAQRDELGTYQEMFEEAGRRRSESVSAAPGATAVAFECPLDDGGSSTAHGPARTGIA